MASRPLTSVPLNITDKVETILPIEFRGEELVLDAHAYQGADEAHQAVALVKRGQGPEERALPLVRVHSGCITGDIFHSLRCDCYAQLQAALAEIAKVPNGVLIYLPYHEGRGIGLFKKIRAYALQDKGLDTVDANLEQGEPIDARDYEFAADILRDLGFAAIRLMTNNPDKVAALESAGIDVRERIPLLVEPSPHNKHYLDTKRRRLAHKI